MDAGKETLAFWLLPGGEARAFFTSLVDKLAGSVDGPAFEPHVTLLGAEIDLQRATDLLENVARETRSLRLRVSGIEFSDKYTKTLYVQFHSSADAQAISQALARRAGADGSYDFDPHLSLLYKTMPEAEKEALAREIRIPFEEVTFDALKLVSVPTPIETPADVHAWRAIAERQLTGGTR